MVIISQLVLSSHVNLSITYSSKGVRDNIVSIAIRYELDVSGFEPRRRRDLRQQSTAASNAPPPQSFVQWLCPGGKAGGGGVALTIHPPASAEVKESAQPCLCSTPVGHHDILQCLSKTVFQQ